MRIIKKYQNRKYYDLQTSSYTTLKGIVGMVRAGEQVLIKDRHQVDITRQTLAKALVENIYLDLDFVEQMIKSGAERV